MLFQFLFENWKNFDRLDRVREIVPVLYGRERKTKRGKSQFTRNLKVVKAALSALSMNY